MPQLFSQTKSSRTPNSLPRWNLKDLLRYPDKDLATRSQTLNDHVRSLEHLRNRLCSTLTPRTFLKGLQLREMIAAESSRLTAYAQLWFAQNTQSQRARAFETQVRKHLLPFSNRTFFFDLWWQRLGNRTAQRLLRHAGSFRYHLESLRRVKQHTLSEAEEQVINVKNTTGREALDSLYDVITNGLTFQLDSREGSQPLSREQLTVTFPGFFRSRAPAGLRPTFSGIFETGQFPWGHLQGPRAGLEKRRVGSSRLCQPDYRPEPPQRHPRWSSLDPTSNLSRQPARIPGIFSDQGQNLRAPANDALRRLCAAENQESLLPL